jgi:hypothetical protein
VTARSSSKSLSANRALLELRGSSNTSSYTVCVGICDLSAHDPVLRAAVARSVRNIDCGVPVFRFACAGCGNYPDGADGARKGRRSARPGACWRGAGSLPVGHRRLDDILAFTLSAIAGGSGALAGILNGYVLTVRTPTPWPAPLRGMGCSASSVPKPGTAGLLGRRVSALESSGCAGAKSR